MRPADWSTAEGMLYTDAYQLTMAQLYFRAGLHERPAQFEHFFRTYPDYGTHQAGFCVNAGLQTLLDWMDGVRFEAPDLELLRSQTGRTGEPLFADDFLAWLGGQEGFGSMSLLAIPEGRVVHAGVPLTVARGPLAMAQILETPLLNMLNYETLVATKASRVAASARGRPVIDFGMRRGPSFGANLGTRASLIGGAHASSNAGMSHVLGYPPAGTHAHSMVQAFMAVGEGEVAAFEAYAEVYPDDCMLLVDTVDTLESGIPNTIRVFEALRSKGHVPVGIRLDSGDLAYLSIQAALLLDAAGFPDVSIVLSGGLDELAIWQILTQIEQEAPRYGVDADHLIGRFAFGVGARLVSSHGASALDGVYKIVAIEDEGEWVPAIKVTESPAKIPNPGDKRVWRLYDNRNTASADILAMADEEIANESLVLHHPIHEAMRRRVEGSDIAHVEPLLVEVLNEGRQTIGRSTVFEMQKTRDADLERLDPGVRRLINPHIYHVSLTERAWALKQQLIHDAESGA